MLAANRSACVTPEVNLREHVTHTPPPSVNKAAHSGFETQKSKTGVAVTPQKGLMSCKNFKKINSRFICWKKSLPGSECTLLVVHTRRIPMCGRKEEILVFRTYTKFVITNHLPLKFTSFEIRSKVVTSKPGMKMRRYLAVNLKGRTGL